MRSSQFFISTLKEAPADAEVVSHKLMIRAGLIRRLAGGIYSWMPLGLKVLRKVEAIVREEMNRAGAIELSMPVVQPAELWQESGRWGAYGQELLRFQDRHKRDFVIQPTSEEVITDIARSELRSYRQLPVNFYQIQVKFRDERRPRFGVMRGREFVMKDAYSFHASLDDLRREYDNMHATYTRIFTRLGLKFRSVDADPGSIGGTGSHEFHVLADSGEDMIAYSTASQFAANIELAEAVAPNISRPAPSKSMTCVPTPGLTTCEQVGATLGIPKENSIKTIAISTGEPGDLRIVLLLLRGDHTLNEVKVSKIRGLETFRFATEEEVFGAVGCKPGFIGPVGVRPDIPIIADRSVIPLSDFFCGANKEDHHLIGVNWERDLALPSVIADLRNVVPGDPSPDGQGTLEICRGIEVGHVFQLRTKYSEPLNCKYVDEAGESKPMEMGCYGIGVTRIVAAAIEQCHDSKGIAFPAAIAPFEVAVIPLGAKKSQEVANTAISIYDALRKKGIDVMIDDRDERPGVLLADIELLGIPHRVVVGERSLKSGTVEYQGRLDLNSVQINVAECATFVASKLRQTP